MNAEEIQMIVSTVVATMNAMGTPSKSKNSTTKKARKPAPWASISEVSRGNYKGREFTADKKGTHILFEGVEGGKKGRAIAQVSAAIKKMHAKAWASNANGSVAQYADDNRLIEVDGKFYGEKALRAVQTAKLI